MGHAPATTVKVFIDVFIGVWAFVLAIIWSTKIEAKKGEKVSPGRNLGLPQIRDRLHAHLPGFGYN